MSSGDPPHASDLTAFQRSVLAVLAEEARYGLAIKEELEEFYGTDINHGRLYPNLDDLVDMGLVEKTSLDRRTNEYALTGDGEAVLCELIEWYVERFATDEGRTRPLAQHVEAADD